MSLKTQISLQSSWDWTSITLTDITGTGITGYGAQQNPIGYREISDINSGKIKITDRNGVITTLTKTGVQMQSVATSGLTITPYNVGLDNLPNTKFNDTVFTFLYLPWFTNAISITVTPNNKTITYTGDNANFDNVTHIKDTVNSNEYSVASINTATKTITLTTAWAIGGSTGTVNTYLVGISDTAYVAISSEIQTCLDNKVADLATKHCKCTVTEIMHAYLIYDSMHLNLAQGNQTKGYQAFDWLTTKCSEDCGCY